MNLPSHDEVVAIGMVLYRATFLVVFVLAVFTILYILWHLVPKKEY